MCLFLGELCFFLLTCELRGDSVRVCATLVFAALNSLCRITYNPVQLCIVFLFAKMKQFRDMIRSTRLMCIIYLVIL